MKVLKRDATHEDVSFDKITLRLKRLCSDPQTGPALRNCDCELVAQKTCASVYDGISTVQIDGLSAEIAVALTTTHPNYETLAARILVSDLHKQTSPSTLATFSKLWEARNGDGEPVQLLNDETWGVLKDNHALFDSWLDWTADYGYNFFAVKTLQSMYLTKVAGKVVERPQHMLLRFAAGLWGRDLDNVKRTYEFMSQRLFTHATPSLFNSGMRRPQFSSCFLLGIEAGQESVEGIFDKVKECGMISKYAGGIGLHIHDVRSKGALIRGTNGLTNGIVPMLRVLNETARYINQAGRRPGAIAVYLEPHHPDIFDFLELRRSSGDESERCRDLFPALWLSDLFMRRVEARGTWSLFDPKACPGLSAVWGEDYDALYERYEEEKRYVRQVEAQDLWFAILTSVQETSLPYMLSKDACNRKSNQQSRSHMSRSRVCLLQCSCLMKWRPRRSGVYQKLEPVHGDSRVHVGGRDSSV